MIACGARKKEIAKEEKPVAVTVAAVAKGNLAISKTYSGTIEGWKQAKIYASIPEAIVELPFSEGSLVEAGQPVVKLDKEGSASHFRQAEAMYQDAKDNYEKMGNLYQQGAISQQTYNNLKTNLEVARANYESARQQVELTSPITGILTDLSVNVGQYAPIGVPLATIAQTDKIRMTIYVDGRSASFIKAGQPAKIEISGGENSDEAYESKVTEVARSADPETRAFRAELQIDNQNKHLRPGLFARAVITVDELDNILIVPKEAVFLVEGVAKVYKLDGDRARSQTITLGESTPEAYQIVSGLAQGDQVIVLGRNLVEDGTLVKVMENSKATQAAEKPKEG